MPAYYDINALKTYVAPAPAPAPIVPRDHDTLLKKYGVYTQPYATVWPELGQRLRQLYATRLVNVPWLPSDWQTVILGSVHGRNGNIAVIAPSTANYNGGRGADFLNTAEKKQWWDELSAVTSKAITSFAAQKAEEGRREIAAAEADVAFWDSAYRFANFLAAPVNAFKSAADTYNKYQWAFNPAIVIGVGLAGLYFFTRK
jgi:hypothetical protein